MEEELRLTAPLSDGSGGSGELQHITQQHSQTAVKETFVVGVDLFYVSLEE